MDNFVQEVTEKYNTIEIDGAYYIFRKEITPLMFDYVNSGWRSALMCNSEFVYTKERCIKNRLISLETANLIYKKLGLLIITEKQLQTAKEDIKELVNKVL